ncbi:MAG: hypothetical protein EZS28_007901 [Streblomastix strix]|uniref:Uncharacterized protein n=1 Tax=Streblomastix strix TaxID=222440 RepID=A0A5J4WP06_9EUKA|nr:MAG: hypothetical protein EZS28_007901 [Streblomastix strix]
MKYDDENIPFDRCIKVLRWNSSRFDIALLWDALDCELWTMGVPIGDLNNTKSITVTHKKSHMKLQFIDAENLFGPMTLKACVIDYGDKTEHKGGLAAVFHRENTAGRTYINELTYDEQQNKVISQDNENVVTHVFVLDGNSRSRFCSEKPYVIKNCIDQRKDIFIAKVKGYISKSEYNKIFALPPIFRNIEIENKEEVIGEYMYSQAQKHSLPMTKKDRKQTTLVETNGQFMVFNNDQLWLFIDLGFIITEYKAIAVFEKNTAYEPFVRTIMNLRIQAILAGSSKEKFQKLKINASFGYDTLNTEKFGKIKLSDRADTFIAQHHHNHIGTRRISANTFAVQIKPKTATCFTSLQSDRKRFHFVLAETDSICIAIAGDPNKDCHQQFESIVTDKQFYDQHVYQYLPDPNKDIYDYKKILGFGIENEGYELTSL